MAQRLVFSFNTEIRDNTWLEQIVEEQYSYTRDDKMIFNLSVYL